MNAAEIQGRVLGLLGGLGATPGAIADALTARGITGRREVACGCPIANFLFEQLRGISMRQAVVGDSDITIYLHTYDHITVATPGPVTDFIRLFDGGCFPSLVTPALVGGEDRG